MHLLRSIPLVSVLLALSGCAHQPKLATSGAHRYLSVSFPRVKLAEHEYIQSVEVFVRCGRIVSIERLLDDWDLEVQWDNSPFGSLLWSRPRA